MAESASLHLKYSAELERARQRAIPLVALETTILSFGLPRPLNYQVGQQCEQLIRDGGAVPATLALLNGEMRVGLDDGEIQLFCDPAAGIQKVNLQNFAAVLHKRTPGALTVAASLRVASLAGIRVFATGGIGGVHRDFGTQLDVSSDLTALSRFPVATICAGAKSILDVSATLEALETLGVPVVGYGTRVFPLFHARESSHRLDVWFDDAEELAEYLQLHWQVSGTGVLIVTPIPAEHAIAPVELNGWISQALKLASDQGISGKATTPFLLKQLENLSGGKSLEANTALIRNNAALGARISVAFSKLP